MYNEGDKFKSLISGKIYTVCEVAKDHMVGYNEDVGKVRFTLHCDYIVPYKEDNNETR